MSYMDTKFCEICDEDYNWACPECPGCAARNSWNHLNDKYQFLIERHRLAKQVIEALPKCDRPNCDSLATRYEKFNELDLGVEFETQVWRCEEHKTTNGTDIDELNYAAQLKEYLNHGKQK